MFVLPSSPSLVKSFICFIVSCRVGDHGIDKFSVLATLELVEVSSRFLLHLEHVPPDDKHHERNRCDCDYGLEEA